jgi:hypothetical protein
LTFYCHKFLCREEKTKLPLIHLIDSDNIDLIEEVQHDINNIGVIKGEDKFKEVFKEYLKDL